MSHVLELTDEQYHTIERAAASRGQTPDALIASWIDLLNEAPGGLEAYETEDWFRHLGMTEEQIAESARLAAADDDADAQ